MPRDHRDFGETPKPTKNFRLPDPLPTKRSELLAVVAAQGKFPPRAARWCSPQEIRHLLRGDFPFESGTLYAVLDPRQIKSPDDLLTLAADRRVAYRDYLKAKAADEKPTTRITPKQKS